METPLTGPLLPSDLDPVPCWPWGGEHREDGRPLFGHRYAYRLTYSLFRGAIPSGRDLHHECEHGWCCNPWHVEPLTPREHRQRHPQQRPLRPLCPRGHEYDYISPNGNGRQCLQCITLYKRARRAWLRAIGHTGSCGAKRCAPTCERPEPAGPFHWDG